MQSQLIPHHLSQHQSQLIPHHLSQHQSDLNSKTPFFMSNMTYMYSLDHLKTLRQLLLIQPHLSLSPSFQTIPSNLQPLLSSLQSPRHCPHQLLMVIILALSLQQHQSLSLQQHQPQSLIPHPLSQHQSDLHSKRLPTHSA